MIAKEWIVISKALFTTAVVTAGKRVMTTEMNKTNNLWWLDYCPGGQLLETG